MGSVTRQALKGERKGVTGIHETPEAGTAGLRSAIR
jgi:hypothetical protein